VIRDLATEVIDYKAVFKNFPGVAFLLNADLEILDASDGVRELTGRKRDDLVGRNFFEAFPANPGDVGCARSLPGRRAPAVAP
jgi:PAS domain-containing protein